jgi:hypothetical protein
MNNEKLLKAQQLKSKMERIEKVISKCNILPQDSFSYTRDKNYEFIFKEIINATNLGWIILKNDLEKKLFELKQEFENL